MDEQTIPFQGISAFKARTGKYKRVGDGLRVESLNCALTGYTSDFYLGVDNQIKKPELKINEGRKTKERVTLGSAASSIIYFISNLEESGRVVVCDNLYTNVVLAEELRLESGNIRARN